jgi:septal ring factor EnvC (AmiA/AmiB activator)
VKKIAVIFALCAANCFADELSRVNSQIAAAEKQKDAVKGKIVGNEKATRETKRDLVKVAAELSELESEKASVESRIDFLDKKKSALVESIKKSGANLAVASGALVSVGQGGAPLDGAGGDYILQMAVISAMAENIDDEMRAAAEQVRELNKLQVELEKQRGNFAAVEKKHRREMEQLDKLLRARASQNETLRARQYELQKQLSDLSKQAKNLSELADKVVVPRASAPERRASNSRRLRFPVSGMLLLRFGDLNAAEMRSDGWRVRSNSAAVVAAPADGAIKFASDFGRYGFVVMLDHGDGYISVMTGLGGVDVMVGQEVLAGEPVGRMPVSSPELYLELRHGARAVDPARMFSEPK